MKKYDIKTVWSNGFTESYTVTGKQGNADDELHYLKQRLNSLNNIVDYTILDDNEVIFEKEKA